MIKRRRAKKSFDEMGKRWYDFDSQLEKAIYSHLCWTRVKRKISRKLTEDLKFHSYQQWKCYIYDKYQAYDKEKLDEFSRYLNQNIRNTKPSLKYWAIMATALITIAFTSLIDRIINIKLSADIPIWGMIILVLVGEIFFILLLFSVIIQTMYPIFDNSADENLYEDYKEIIDEIMRTKIKEENRLEKESNANT